MDGFHRVVGVGGLIVFLLILVANYLIVYLIVSNALKNSDLKLEINNLKNEIKDLKELLNKQPIETLSDNKDN
ncbi:hypothetical protein SAMN05661091_5772 [Paenibacillus uliginis N3/975]|uniref:Uncharacterized protein n=1 Tax=Paenibacillus uliginis N3/975 TaxID=1313296 RepID=A0A1X7HSV3_9BACL|nr:hypothetical protein [Paenibacillus uliginis]SMF92324.1 hypothetical protein SAMN05661091_5772 [Paenibacillus uliginis N3/975]